MLIKFTFATSVEESNTGKAHNTLDFTLNTDNIVSVVKNDTKLVITTNATTYKLLENGTPAPWPLKYTVSFDNKDKADMTFRNIQR